MLAASMYWLGVEYCLMVVDGELWFCAIVPLVMNMGTRPASKIACRFSEEWLGAWWRQMRTHVADVWLPQQTPALRRALDHRRNALGAVQADPFYADCFTDNFWFFFVGPQLGAVGAARVWRAQCTDANL